MKLLRAALCSNETGNPDIVIEIPNELHDDAETAQFASALTTPDADVAEASAALESLLQVQQLMHSHRVAYPAMESIAETGSMALEGKIVDSIRNGFDNYFQSLILSQKHQNDIFLDFWKSTNSLLSKYNKALKDTEEEFHEKAHKFREGEHHASLIELWYFFTTKNGQSRNVVADLSIDVPHSAYILVEYPKAVLGALTKLNGLLRNAKLDSDKNAGAFFSAVEKLPSIEDLFKSQHLGEGILFNVTSVERKVKPSSHVVELDGHRFTELAELSNRAEVIESKSVGHTAWKIFGHGGIAKAVKNYEREDFKLSTKEIGDLIEFGKHYIRNVEGYLSLKTEIDRAFNDTKSAIEKLQRSATVDSMGARQGIKQVTGYLNNLSKAITTPALDEVVRSIKGAKYCNYIALRLIYNASKYF